MPLCTVFAAMLAPAVIAKFEPRRFAVTATGTFELGTCDARVYMRPAADGRPEYVRLPPRPNDYGSIDLSLWRESPAGLDAPRHVQTADGAVFRRYAAGRLAVRDAVTGDIRVAFDRPRLAAGYGRLHYCSTATDLFYVTTCHGYDGGSRDAIRLKVTRLPHAYLPHLPARGHPDAAAGRENTPAYRLLVDNDRIHGFDSWLPDAFTPDILPSTFSPQADLPRGFMAAGPRTVGRLPAAFDIACVSEDDIYAYLLEGGAMVQYRRTRPAGKFSWSTPWAVAGRYATDLAGPFWIVQAASHFFVAVDLRGRVVQFTRGLAGTKAQEVARSGSRVQITQGVGPASIVSDQYNLRVAPSGVSALVNSDVPRKP